MRKTPLYVTTANLVYDELKALILGKKLKAGQRLPEKAIAERMKVSRTPVREALKRLASEGIVEMVPGGGARLVSPSEQEIREAFEVRCGLETMAIKKALRRITPVQICLLEEQIETEERSFLEKDLEKYLTANKAFHSILAEASGNSLLAEYANNVMARTHVYMVLYESFFSFEGNPSLEEHRAIVQAIRKGDETLAIRLVRNHIEKSIGSLLSKDSEEILGK